MAKQLHHFVPRFYLKQFCDATQQREDLTWVYERGAAEPDLRPPDRVAAQKDYYAAELERGRKTQAVEEALSQIEGYAAPIFTKFKNGDRKLSDEERGSFALFLALGWGRVPKFRDNVEELATTLIKRISRNCK